MCGIAGIVGAPRAVADARLSLALRRLAHRGPDGEGRHADEQAALGMRRLAIIDLEAGGQPIFNEDRSVAVVGNGEIYDYPEQFATLRSRGHRLQSESDMNVIPHLYEELGARAFEQCRGMFAVALWDSRARRLLLARDRLGKKPLFYAQSDGSLMFASELPALLGLLPRTPAISGAALGLYLQLGFVPHPWTIYEGVHALPPGCVLSYSPGGSPAVTPFWVLEEPAPFPGSLTDAMGELDRHLRDAVTIRLRSDVPVGLLLSGGLDSSLVAAHAAEAGARALLCFVVEVADPRFNEAPQAALVARHLGLELETIPLDYDPAALLETVATIYGQPFGDSSAVPSYVVARAAARHRKVVLNGDGGDEVFGGYRRYQLGRAAPWLTPVGRAVAPVAAATGRYLARRSERRSAVGFVARALRGMAASPESRYLVWTSDLFDTDLLTRCFPDLAAASGPALSRLAAIRGERTECTTARAFRRSDLRLILPDDLLTKMDIATMAHGLEARSPLLDVPLVEFAWSLPEAWVSSGRTTKPLLRALAHRYLPPEIEHAPKRGFEVPMDRWVKEQLRERIGDLLLAPDGRVLALGDRRLLRRVIVDGEGFWGNHPQLVWSLLVLESFLRSVPQSESRHLAA